MDLFTHGKYILLVTHSPCLCKKTFSFSQIPINGFTQTETRSLIEAEIGKAACTICLHKLLYALSNNLIM